MSELPRGWTSASLDATCHLYQPETLSMKQIAAGGMHRVYGANGPIGWHTDFNHLDSEVLITCRGATCGRINVSVPMSWINGNAMVASPRDSGIRKKFLALVLEAVDISGAITGSAQPQITRSKLGPISIPIPPTSEQERIVTAIEEAFSKLDAGEAGLRTARRLLRRMRAAVLAAAVSGRLVRQDPADSPSAKLMAGLGIEPLNDPGLPVLPSTWLWTQVQDVGQVDLGRQRSPKNHSGDNMKPYLRVANVFEDRIDTSDVMEMHFEPEAFERSRLAVGDILLNEGQTPELLGRPAMYRGEPPDVAFTNSLLRFRAGPRIVSEWALLVFRQHMHSGRFTRESRITTNIAHLSAARFKPVEFPVPPIEEQRRIVEEFDRLSSVMAACERAVDAALVGSAALRRSVLKAAFEGRLVPQDSLDEPASVLLDRIRAERVASDGWPGGRRRKKLEAP